MNYILGYIVCSLIVWLILHDYKTDYLTQKQLDEERLFLFNAILFAPLTLICVIYIAAEYGVIKTIKCLRRSLLLIFSLLAVAATFTGCAGYRVHDNGSVDTWGVLRTLTVRKEYYDSGNLKSNTISTESTTKDALLGLNELVDTAVNTAAKLKP